MPGPAPNPNSIRPRNGGVWVKLPSEGRKGDAPPWPLESEPDLEVLARWRYLWKLPQAVAWERLSLERTVARYCSILMYAEASMVPAVQSSCVQLEDRLGLNAMSLARLRWTVVEDEVAEKREQVAVSARARFKAVDKDAKSA